MTSAIANLINYLKSQLSKEQTCPNYCIKTYKRIVDKNSENPHWVEYNTKSPFLIKVNKN